MIKRLADESALLYTLLTALGAALAIDVLWVKVICAAAALLLGLLVRQTVSSPTTVIGAVTDAALQTAQTLTSDTVGAAGEVAGEGLGVVNDVVSSILTNVGGLVPKLGRS